jgi:hypothetical protein
MGMFQKIIKEYGGFETLKKTIGEKQVDKISDELYQHYCKEFDDKSYLKNVEWLLRHYNASKKITLSVLFFTQAQFIYEKNSKNLVFYALYYSLFNAFSSNILLLPYLDLENARRISHGKIFTYIDNYFVRKGLYKLDAIDLLNDLRMVRELYSYHLPLGGSIVKEGKKLHIDEIYKRVEELLPLILQVSNMLSYLSHYAWEKKVGKAIDEYEKYQSVVDEMFFSFIEHADHLGKHCLIDDDDYYRQGYVLREWQTPFPISWFITEKMCEDLECGWEQPEDKIEGYNINEVGHYLANTIDAF